MSTHKIVEELLALTRGKPPTYSQRHAFSTKSARLWVRARFSCEYCEHSMVDRVLEYQSFNYDHVLPRVRYSAHPILGVSTRALFDIRYNFSDEDLNCFALSCRLCNALKGSFDANAEDPIFDGKSPLSTEIRAILIARIRACVLPLRHEHEEMRESIREVARRHRLVP
jgi:hypothetical protein